MTIRQCDYGNLCSRMREKRLIKNMILAKCTDMKVVDDTGNVSIILQLCIQTENRPVTPLFRNEKCLQLYAPMMQF